MKWLLAVALLVGCSGRNIDYERRRERFEKELGVEPQLNITTETVEGSPLPVFHVDLYRVFTASITVTEYTGATLYISPQTGRVLYGSSGTGIGWAKCQEAEVPVAGCSNLEIEVTVPGENQGHQFRITWNVLQRYRLYGQFEGLGSERPWMRGRSEITTIEYEGHHKQQSIVRFDQPKTRRFVPFAPARSFFGIPFTTVLLPVPAVDPERQALLYFDTLKVEGDEAAGIAPFSGRSTVFSLQYLNAVTEKPGKIRFRVEVEP